VLCDAVVPKLIIEPLQLVFKKVFNPDTNHPQEGVLRIQNPSEQSLVWKIKKGTAPEFWFEEWEGTIHPGETRRLKVFFNSRCTGEFEDEY
jgi:hypothetical protein